MYLTSEILVLDLSRVFEVHCIDCFELQSCKCVY